MRMGNRKTMVSQCALSQLVLTAMLQGRSDFPYFITRKTEEHAHGQVARKGEQSQDHISLAWNPLLFLHHTASYVVLGLGNLKGSKVTAEIRGAKCSSFLGPSSWTGWSWLPSWQVSMIHCLDLSPGFQVGSDKHTGQQDPPLHSLPWISSDTTWGPFGSLNLHFIADSFWIFSQQKCLKQGRLGGSNG